MGQCAKGFKCKFSHDLNVQRKGEKIDIYSDKRDEGNSVDLLIYSLFVLIFWLVLIFSHCLILRWFHVDSTPKIPWRIGIKRH